MRREWIEIRDYKLQADELARSPSMRREWIEMGIRTRYHTAVAGLPPCGGSGLKLPGDVVPVVSMAVSLHAEGVD